MPGSAQMAGRTVRLWEVSAGFVGLDTDTAGPFAHPRLDAS